MATWEYASGARYALSYGSGEFDAGAGPAERVWIDDPELDPADPTLTLDNELRLRSSCADADDW